MVEPEFGLETQLKPKLVHSNNHSIRNYQGKKHYLLIQMVSSEYGQHNYTVSCRRMEAVKRRYARGFYSLYLCRESLKRGNKYFESRCMHITP